jgi:ubiquinone biosynthesis protein COQ9
MTDSGEQAQAGLEPGFDAGLGALRARLLEAALPHVPFDGWSAATLAAAARETGVGPAEARAAFPRGGIDLALEFHAAGDRALAAELAAGAGLGLRYSERVAHAVRRRLEIAAPHRDAVRRAASLFALPLHAAEGARALWRTADTIWTGLGDTSRDLNHTTKRITLSGVISTTLLYWLGDRSEGSADTWAFLDRRIADVMRIEKAKAAVRDNPLARLALAGPRAVLARLREGAARRRRPEAAEPFPEKVEPAATDPV